MLRIVQPGMMTTVQDYPGRVGYAHLGIPASGAMDSLALRVANRLAGNSEGEAGLEFVVQGPSIEFLDDTVFSVCGADCTPLLDGTRLSGWRTLSARRGQVLTFELARSGLYGYIAFHGGIQVPQVMGSRSTYVDAGLGGLEGRRLRAGDELEIGLGTGQAAQRLALKPEWIPRYDQTQEVELLYGSHWDWLSEADLRQMYETEWKVSRNSNRLGYRLEGPEFEFSRIAHEKPVECGAFPSNIYDTGYYLGGVNFAGQTPVVFTADGPTAGGYIQPFIVPDCCLWKVAQTMLGRTLRFRKVERENMQAIRREYAEYTAPERFEPVKD